LIVGIQDSQYRRIDTILMTPWAQIVDLGHTAVMLPLAGAIAAWLVAARAWKAALYWCVIFASGLGLVALSKIAFLGWGCGIPALDFQALSGHAYRVSAVIPVSFFLLLRGASSSLRTGGIVLSMGVSIALGALLVHFKFHTLSEVVASLILGASVSLCFVRIATTLPTPRWNRWALPFSIIVLMGICVLKPSSINHRLVDIALYLSGRHQAYGWSKNWDL
jgi:hypothetical protein